jgi:sec-independent protein translocase protein TatC
MNPWQRGEDLPRMTLLQHLEELRRRIVAGLLALVVAFLVCWGFAKEIFHFLARPIYGALPAGEKLAFLGVTDAFLLYFKVAGLAALFLSAPFWLFQLWRFVSPGLYHRERRMAFPFIFFGTFFFLAGGAFAYYVAFPFALEFLLDVGAEFKAVITVERYFSFLMTVILGLGVMFELPVLIVLLSLIGVVTPQFLLRKFRWAVVIIAFLSAVITPTPDIFNMSLFMIPTLLLYVLGIAGAFLVQRSKRRRALAAGAGGGVTPAS